MELVWDETRDVWTTPEIGYGQAPRVMTSAAAEASEALATRGRIPAVATVWCPQCKRALLCVYRVNGAFLAVSRGKGVPGHERHDESPEGGMAVFPPFLLGETWDAVPLACRCGFPGPRDVAVLDVKALVAALNSGSRRDFVAGAPMY